MLNDNSSFILVGEETNRVPSIDALLETIEGFRLGDYQQVINLSEEAHALALQVEYWPGVAKASTL